MSNEKDMDGLEEAISAEYYSDDAPIWKQKVADEFAVLIRKFLIADSEYDVALRMWDCEIVLKAPPVTDGGEDE